MTSEPAEPYLFDDFIDSGLAEENSPFLKPHARKWARNLELRASLTAAILLILSFAFSFNPALLPLSNFLLLAVYILAGLPALIDSIEDILNLEINIDVLMTLAAFSSILIGSGMEGALLLVLFSISGAMEHTVTQRAKGALSSLRRLAPTTAWVLADDGSLFQRAVRDIQPKTLLLIKAGEVVPLDGKIVDGRSSVNLVHLTGESLPVSVEAGENVAAGSQNLDGVLTVEVTHSSGESTLARIIHLVTQAQEARPRLQQWFDRFSRAYATSIITFSALVTLSLPPLLGIPYLGVDGSLYRALAFLIAASPCALILAIPITYLSAVSACARKGILLKGGLTLDALASCQMLAFDKTGTLTTGELQCVQAECLEGDAAPPAEVLAVAHALERNAVHPVATALVRYAEAAGAPPAKLANFRAIPGSGLEADVLADGTSIKAAVGKPEFINERLDDASARRLLENCEAHRRNGEIVATLYYAEKVYIFAFRDTPREGMRSTLQQLRTEHQLGLLMLTGDHLNSARQVAQELGIDEFYADLKPEDKLDAIASLSKDVGLAMIGDGINDAPALARATAGIAMGQVGSATAMEAADIILLHDNVDHLGWLMSKARLTKRIVKQNLSIALAAIAIASTTALLGVIPLWLAVIMHEGGTVLVGLNGLRLLRG